MKNILIAIFVAFLTLFSSVNDSWATVITFEDLYQDIQEYGQLPANYAGFSWNDSSNYITKNYVSVPSYVNGTVGNVSLFSLNANNIEMTNIHKFDFYGAYINLNVNLGGANSVTVEGLSDGVVTFSETILFSEPYPLTWFDFDFVNIDQLKFKSESYVIHNLTIEFRI